MPKTELLNELLLSTNNNTSISFFSFLFLFLTKKFICFSENGEEDSRLTDILWSVNSPIDLKILGLEEVFLGLHTPCFLGSSKCKSEDDLQGI